MRKRTQRRRQPALAWSLILARDWPCGGRGSATGGSPGGGYGSGGSDIGSAARTLRPGRLNPATCPQSPISRAWPQRIFGRLCRPHAETPVAGRPESRAGPGFGLSAAAWDKALSVPVPSRAGHRASGLRWWFPSCNHLHRPPCLSEPSAFRIRRIACEGTRQGAAEALPCLPPGLGRRLLHGQQGSSRMPASEGRPGGRNGE